MNATSTLDLNTANAIREALGAANKGMVAEACEIGERALAAGGDIIALNAMLGMFRCQSGQLDAGIGHLESAHQARPGDARIATNLVNALASAGRDREALDVLTDELARSDKSHQLLKLRGFLAQNVGDFKASVDSYQLVVSAAPDDFESWNNLGNARRG
ncbi:MAG TPA: tetratricopeptide repeat protein, partial [Vicinamibacterales bacterium]